MLVSSQFIILRQFNGRYRYKYQQTDIAERKMKDFHAGSHFKGDFDITNSLA